MYLASAAVCLALLSFPTPSASSCEHLKPPEVKHANHIFNTIHSSMRQWGSSLNHNGMSFFLAEIPAGVELYHGTGDNITVKGMEWLAFEPEHAMNFARKFVARPGPPKGRKPPPPPFHLDLEDHTALRHQQLLDKLPPGPQDDKRKPPHRGPPGGGEVVPGYLHTYSTRQSLRVIYIDGEAAAKSAKGTLDSQDYLLTPIEDREDDKPGRSGGDDWGRAQQMCSLAAKAWKGRIDGFIRMEHGFELILCDFEKNVELVSMNRVSARRDEEEGDDGESTLAFLRAIGARYHGIGGERVKIDYGRFVTAFGRDLDLFTTEGEDRSALPRLKNITVSQREPLLAELTSLVLSHEFNPQSLNYQSTADLITTRYSDALHSFAFSSFADEAALNRSIALLLRPFIDHDARNQRRETWRCATHFLPSDSPFESPAHKAILSVSYRVCDTLFSSVYRGIEAEDLTSTQTHFQDLVSYLRWTTWKECRPGCAYDEFCLTAIWPMGDERSHETPYCVNASTVEESIGRPGERGGKGYWDGPRPPFQKL